MIDKQQTALQTLIAWGDNMLKNNPHKILSFAEVIDKAEELLPMEQEQIEKAARWEPFLGDYAKEVGEQYYIDNYKSKDND